MAAKSNMAAKITETLTVLTKIDRFYIVIHQITLFGSRNPFLIFLNPKW